MAKMTILFGVLLTILGLVTYFGAESLGASTRSVTALIPAFIGVPLIILGIVAQKPGARKHAMHAAAALALLGFLASFGRFVAVGAAPTSVGPAALLIMAILCGVFVALCVRSFIVARKAREAGTTVT